MKMSIFFTTDVNINY